MYKSNLRNHKVKLIYLNSGILNSPYLKYIIYCSEIMSFPIQNLENISRQIVGSDLPGDLAKVVQGLVDVHGKQVAISDQCSN